MTRKHLMWTLAGLWLLDGLLQLQPGMFTPAMIPTVMQPALAGEPGWMVHLLHWVIHLLSLNIVVANASIAAIQLGLGAALLWRGRERTWPYWASWAWAALLWVFGQALGGVLAGQASLLTGGPGSAVLYALLTWAAWPGEADGAGHQRWIAVAYGALWALGAVLQASPGFFAPSGLSGAILGLADGQPAWLSHLLNWGAAGVAASPRGANAAAVVLMGLTALGVWAGGPWRRLALVVSMIAAAWAWVFGQAFGMIFTGMGTDPNSAPLYAALALYVWGRPEEPSARPVSHDGDHEEFAHAAD